jgi:flagellar biosynthetic protein FlhB
MAEESNAQEKTEQATPHRRREVRRRGQVAKSVEMNSVLMLAAGLLLMAGFYPYLVDRGREFLVLFFRLASEGGATESRFGAMFHEVVFRFFALVAPILIGTAVVALVSNLAQVGFHITPAAIAPRLEKLDPVNAFKRIFGKRALVELTKGILKIVIVALIAYLTYRSRLAEITDLMFYVPGQIFPEAFRIAASFLLRAIVALAALAALDYGYQRWDFERSIRMSRQDLKQEFKENEGDPVLKSRIKAIQQKMATERMMEGVKGATLVITNPTHYAVALQYEEVDPAPRVVAKGKDRIAQRIRELAREHDVPVVEKPSLARLLYKECEIGQIIPTVLYEAVAEVLAYVYSLGRRSRR